VILRKKVKAKAKTEAKAKAKAKVNKFLGILGIPKISLQ
jgi:hypothetical protein